jgi:hypothetical protein
MQRYHLTNGAPKQKKLSGIASLSSSELISQDSVWTSPAFVDTSQSASIEADLAYRYRSLTHDGNWPIAAVQR